MYIYKIEDIWNKINIKGEDECWEWIGCIHRDGYGVCQINKKQLRVHRVVYTLTHNENIDEKVICHHCDNPLCCNPKHLFSGSINDNNQDKIKKGRARYEKGENLNHNKVTEEQVIEIRKRYKNEKITQEQLAQEYGISRPNISLIVNKINWKHI